MKRCPNCFSSGTLGRGKCAVCGFTESAQRENRALLAGIILNQRYMLGRVLGMGGFGVTYVAYDQTLKRRLAIKEYFPAEWAMRASGGNQIVPNSQSQREVYWRGKEVFINEAKVLSKLVDVPGVVDVLDFFQENGTAYMVMELLEGVTLNGYLRGFGHRRMPWKDANRIIREAAMALRQVHEKSLLHRDIGPDNIMIDRFGKVYLIDFGATRIYARNSEKSMSVMLKPGFTPIEQYSRTGNQGPWTDVYALAATYYYLVMGKKPPESPDRVTGARLLYLTQCVSDIPETISRAVDHALTVQWRKRTQSVEEFLWEMGLVKKPAVEMHLNGKWKRRPFDGNNVFTIGRAPGKNALVLEDIQVSGRHCKIRYDSAAERFLVENYSGNCTYTSRGVLKKGQSAQLKKGEWIYIQTAKKRYIFYLEVE